MENRRDWLGRIKNGASAGLVVVMLRGILRDTVVALFSPTGLCSPYLTFKVVPMGAAVVEMFWFSDVSSEHWEVVSQASQRSA